MTANVEQQLLPDLVLPKCRDWIREKFHDAIEIKMDESKVMEDLPSIPALYLYLCKRTLSPFDSDRPFADIRLEGKSFDVLYIGETDNLKYRHKQHGGQIFTCGKVRLVDLLKSALQNNKCASVRDCDRKEGSPFRAKVAEWEKIMKNDRRMKQDYKRADIDCQNSIGWSLAGSVTWVPFDDLWSRVQTEEILIAALRPPLNWMKLGSRPPSPTTKFV